MSAADPLAAESLAAGALSAEAPVAAGSPVADRLVDLLAGPAEPLGLVALAHVLGGVRYVELEAFRSLGQLSAEAGTKPAVAVRASGAALAHAWRARQLEALLPVSAGLPGAADVTLSPGPAVDALLGRLWAGDPEVTAGLSVVLAATYRRRLAHPHPSAEPFVARTLGRLLHDVEERALEGAATGRGT